MSDCFFEVESLECLAMIDLEKELNPQQMKAVQTTEGPLLILAGAGSGKTRVITFRIVHLIENLQLRPEHVLAVTFTNKAAEQMKQRVVSLLRRGRSSNPMISTFHSFCVRLLRRDIEYLGYGRDFSIYDEADQLSLIKACLKEMDIDEKSLGPRTALAGISYAKNHGKTPESFYEKAYDANTEKIAVAFGLYEKKLRQANALDFDDLLLKTVTVLENHPAVLARVNEQFHYLMVDEYQDTNRIQYQLIHLLTRVRQNLCVVGDEDQSIYAWRGADIQNILSFEKDYPTARIIKLEQNYRSTKNILDAAAAVVSNNEARKGKDLWTERIGGELVTLYEAPDAETEATFVTQQILAYQRLNSNGRAGVLYRTNFQSRLFEEACRRTGIKYSIVGGFSFYERAEIKDMMAYLKLGLNPHDSVSLLRIINTPPRGIGKTTLDTLEQESRSRGVSLWEVVNSFIEAKVLTPRSLHALTDFRNCIQELIDNIHKQPASDLIRLILENSGYLRWLQDEDTPEAVSRSENLQELVNASKDSQDRGENLRDFLDHAALTSDTDDYDERAKVTLMTLHSAKGLEFPLVFVVGLEEGLFPHSRSLQDQHGLEEERRLCYVGMTRAEKKLILTRAGSRRLLGGESKNQTERSRFIKEIPSGLLENLSGAYARKRTSTYEGPIYNTAESIEAFYRHRGKQIDLASVKKETNSRANSFRLGSYVRHPTFGVGMVMRCEGEGDESKLTISFPRYGVRKMVQKYADLERV